jgi:mutator protein MutT
MTHLIVCAAVIERDGRVLVTRRPDGVHLGGLWEFPGGKCEPGEAFDACLRREMREELGVTVDVGPEMFAVAHDYDDRRVELHFFRCVAHGDPEPQLGQDLAWARCGDLDSARFPAADAELIRQLRESGAR